MNVYTKHIAYSGAKGVDPKTFQLFGCTELQPRLVKATRAIKLGSWDNDPAHDAARECECP